MYLGKSHAAALLLFIVFETAGIAFAHDEMAPDGSAALLPLRSRPMAYMAITPSPPPLISHRFWDRTNVGLFGGIAVTRTLDYTSTINMQKRGREEILLPDDVVLNRAGFAALEAAAAGTSIGISYLLHRSGHHKLERWLSIGHVSATGFGDVRNYSLQSKHPVQDQRSQVRLQK